MSSSVMARGYSQSSRAPSPRRGAWFWLWVWLPVAAGIAIISIESTPYFGADRTILWLQAVLQPIFGHIPRALLKEINHCLRKSGHFVGYGLIGLAWLRAWWFTLSHSRFFTDFALAMLGTAAIATCDEWHQSFLSNRGSSPWDVLLDCTGAFILQFIVYIYMRLTNPRKLARA